MDPMGYHSLSVWDFYSASFRGCFPRSALSFPIIRPSAAGLEMSGRISVFFCFNPKLVGIPTIKGKMFIPIIGGFLLKVGSLFNNLCSGFAGGFCTHSIPWDSSPWISPPFCRNIFRFFPTTQQSQIKDGVFVFFFFNPKWKNWEWFGKGKCSILKISKNDPIIVPEKGPFRKERLVVQPSVFQGTC